MILFCYILPMLIITGVRGVNIGDNAGDALCKGYFTPDEDTYMATLFNHKHTDTVSCWITFWVVAFGNSCDVSASRR